MIADDTYTWAYVASGTNDTFPYTRKIFDDDDLRVYVDDVLQTKGTHYGVTGVLDNDGGNVVFEAAYIPAASAEVRIVRAVPNTQEQDWQENDFNPATRFEDGLDRVTVQVQQLRNDIDDLVVGDIPVPVAVDHGGTGAVDASTARDNLGLAIGSDVQEYDAVLDTPTATPAASVIPVAKPTGVLAEGWMPRKPGHNLLVNSSFGVCCGLAGKYYGTVIACTGFDVNSNTPKFYTSNYQDIEVGSLVFVATTVSGLNNCAKMVTAVVPGVSFTVQMEGAALSPNPSKAVNVFELWPGDTTGSTGDGPDWWTKSVTLRCWRRWKPALARDGGSPYVMILKKGSGSTEYFYQEIFKSSWPERLRKYAGRTITFGMWVYPKAAMNSCDIYISDGVTTTKSATATGGGWTWLEVTADIGAYSSITKIQFVLEIIGSANDEIYATSPIAILGHEIGEGNYFQPPGEVVPCIVHMTPPTYHGASVSSNRWIRFEQENNGQFPKEAKGIFFALEGINDTKTNEMWVSTNSTAPEITQMVLCNNTGAGNKQNRISYYPFHFPSRLYLGVTGGSAAWYAVNIDIAAIEIF